VESKRGWYIHWDTEIKAELIRRLREIRMCPDHFFWEAEQPDEAGMDAFIADAFGVPGYPSAVNEARMIHALLGNEENRDQETQSLLQYLLEKYHIHSEVTAEEMKQGGSEINRETAGQIVKDAVCEAWNMPKDAMEKWECTTQLVQAPATPQHASLVCYRVFLTRPDSEVGQDTFGGRDNFNYRILLNGTVMDYTMVSEWYSPSEDVKRSFSVKQLGELFKTFFTQKGILLSLAFILLYRLGESQLAKIASPFMLDPMDKGGLGLATEQVGFAYGTVGVVFLLHGDKDLNRVVLDRHKAHGVGG
jgi:hypothetical protein